MRLESFKFSEFQNSPQEWILDRLAVGPKNLLVGKNATGKTRTLNVIGSLARNLAGLPPFSLSGHYEAEFSHFHKKYSYEYIIEDHQVLFETLSIDGKVLLKRGEGGIGSIFSEKIENGIEISFQSPTSDLAAVVRRDSIQHSFLEPLHEWGSSLRHYHFGSTLGKGNLTIFQPDAPKVDERDENAVVGIFRAGFKKFGKAFLDAIISDLQKVDYFVEQIDIGSPISIKIQGIPGEPVGLFVKEKDLPGITDQFSMSQGMFRVLSLLIHVNFFQIKKTETCVLVDDIGEGLDFDRSCRLIELLRNKADNSVLQIILSTNDRFVMNQVPLVEWTVLQRNGNHIIVRNHNNSREKFEEFKFTGLSNFSFFEMDVLGEPSSKENPSDA